MLARAATPWPGATVFAYVVQDPHRYGVLSFDDEGCGLDRRQADAAPVEIRCHRPVLPDNQVVGIAEGPEPPPRGELEITDVYRRYLERGHLRVEQFGRGSAWLDTGTPESLMQAANFVEIVQSRQNLEAACIGEVIYRMGYTPRVPG
jgi:glucose-1-phosphate thymidylyltransferase